MKKKVMSIVLVLTLGLILWVVPVAKGAQYLTVNGKDIASITLELGQSRTVEVVSNDSTSYVDYVGFDNGVVLGTFSHLETRKEAGNFAAVAEYNKPAFYGYHVSAAGISPPPSAGVHFVFEYVAQELGTTYVKLYDSKLTSLIDSVNITVMPLQPAAMGTAFTYQGRLIDANDVADGLYDFKFKLYDNADPVFAAQQGSTIDINDLDVIDGYFTVELDFGSGIFDGDGRWLQIGVRPGDSTDPNAFVTLGPRTELTPTPYAIYAETAGAVPGGISGSGTANYIAKFTGSDTLGDSAIYEEAGNVGIGTASTGSRLEVNGQVKVTGGSPGAGKVLTSDAGGLATWQTPSIGGDSDWMVSGNDMYSIPSGKVGIGTTTPGAKLEVAGDVKISGSSTGGTIAATNSNASGYGVYGAATTGGDVTNYGGYFESPSKFGGGVYGLATNSYGGKGVWGKATGDAGVGVYGETDGSINPAIMGVASNTSTGKGVLGQALGTSGIGIMGVAMATTGTNYGVYGTTNSPAGYAGYFNGDVKITGSGKGLVFPDGTKQTTAAQVYFFVKRDASYTAPTTLGNPVVTVDFSSDSTVWENEGGGFHQSSSEFVAPVSGVYTFDGRIRLSGTWEGHGIYAELYAASRYYSGSRKHAESMSDNLEVHITVHLNAGDSVILRVSVPPDYNIEVSGYSGNKADTYFSGALIN